MSYIFKPITLFVIFAGLLASIGTLLSLFSEHHWVADLFSHFHIQYFVILAIAWVFALLTLHFKSSVLFLVAAYFNAYTVSPLFMSPDASENTDKTCSDSIRAMQLNVNANSEATDKVSAAIDKHQPDILVLEEVTPHWLKSIEPSLTGYKHKHTQPELGNFGLALYSKYRFTRLKNKKPEVKTFYPEDNKHSSGAPAIQARLKIKKQSLGVAVIHPFPPLGAYGSDRRNQYLKNLATLPTDKPFILLGDMNVTPWSHHFKQLLKNTNLTDSTLGNGYQPTWFTQFPLSGIPIDHFLYTSQSIEVIDKKTGIDVGSDHRPVIVDFKICGA